MSRRDGPPVICAGNPVKMTTAEEARLVLYALGDKVPAIDESAYVHPTAVVIGSVTIGPNSSIWPNAVLRGDHGRIIVGARTSIQDGTVVHTTLENPTTVGDDCVIGHNVHLEGCIIEDKSLVGSGSVVLHAAIVRSGGLVAANAVVTNGQEVPSHATAFGVPAKIRPDSVNSDMIATAAAHYVENGALFRAELREIG
jgi:carbonic anhydrase/acetyltransferase-like protein (isoleucine patch superfamily)